MKTAEEEAAVNHNDPAKVELFAARVFKMIVKRHAPWRLDEGETE